MLCAMTQLVERLFTLEARRTTVARELGGALATFLTMAYILFANPGILAAAGVPFESAVAATALAAGICSIAMGLIAVLAWVTVAQRIWNVHQQAAAAAAQPETIGQDKES